MKTATILVGKFNPPTKGHIKLIKTAIGDSRKGDDIIVGVGSDNFQMVSRILRESASNKVHFTRALGAWDFLHKIICSEKYSHIDVYCGQDRKLDYLDILERIVYENEKLITWDVWYIPRPPGSLSSTKLKKTISKMKTTKMSVDEIMIKIKSQLPITITQSQFKKAYLSIV